MDKDDRSYLLELFLWRPLIGLSLGALLVLGMHLSSTGRLILAGSLLAAVTGAAALWLKRHPRTFATRRHNVEPDPRASKRRRRRR
jgi:hypothetical protein